VSALFSGSISSHDGKRAFPGAASDEVEDLPRFDPANELLEGALHGARVGALSAEASGLLQKLLIKHKICTFHTHSVAAIIGQLQ
jgi:hypothetical protein